MLSDHVHGKPSLTPTSLHALGFGHTKSLLFPTTVAQLSTHNASDTVRMFLSILHLISTATS